LRPAIVVFVVGSGRLPGMESGRTGKSKTWQQQKLGQSTTTTRNNAFAQQVGDRTGRSIYSASQLWTSRSPFLLQSVLQEWCGLERTRRRRRNKTGRRSPPRTGGTAPRSKSNNKHTKMMLMIITIITTTTIVMMIPVMFAATGTVRRPVRARPRSSTRRSWQLPM
jgi:hypothetical protein